jgi:hypothetical protein
VLLNYHIGRLVLSSLCAGDLVRLVLSDARLQAEAQLFLCFDVVIQQHSRKLLMMDILMSGTC